MSRHARESKTSSQGLWNYLITVLVSATMGAAITWLITSQHSTSQVRPATMAPPTAPAGGMAPDVSGLSPTEAAVTLGNFAYDHQRWSEAIQQYQRAIAAGADNADVRTDLGNSFRFSGQPDKALEQYQIAHHANPQHENSLYNQISLFSEVMNQPQRAIPLCEEFIRTFPTSEKLPAVREQLDRARNALP